MPDVIYAVEREYFDDFYSDSQGRVWDYSLDSLKDSEYNYPVEKYHHDRILKAKDAEIASLHLEIDDCHKRLNRWADAHNELIGEVELRKRVAELETFIQSRGIELP